MGAPRAAPSSPWTGQKDRMVLPGCHNWRGVSPAIYIEKHDPARTIYSAKDVPVCDIDRLARTTQAALRATNRQLRAETLDVLARIKPELDVMLVNRSGIFPTWLTSSPVPQNSIQTLYIRFRIFDLPDDLDAEWQLRAIPDKPNSASSTMGNLLLFFSRYLMDATQGRENTHYKAPGYPAEEGWGFRPVIHSVVINIETSDVALLFRTEDEWSPVFGYRIFTMSYEGPTSPKKSMNAVNARYESAYNLVQSIDNALEHILLYDVETSHACQDVLGSVGEARILVDGELLRTVDVGHYFYADDEIYEPISGWVARVGRMCRRLKPYSVLRHTFPRRDST